MCNVYSYMRISTSEERDLQKFTRQESALQRYAKENDIEYLLEFREDKSGKNHCIALLSFVWRAFIPSE